MGVYVYGMVLSVSVVNRRDHIADWEPRFTIAAQHHESTVPHITHPEKDQNLKFEAVSTECISISHFIVQKS